MLQESPLILAAGKREPSLPLCLSCAQGGDASESTNFEEDTPHDHGSNGRGVGTCSAASPSQSNRWQLQLNADARYTLVATVEVPMTFTGYERKIAKANGLEVRTRSDGQEYAVPAGARSDAPAVTSMPSPTNSTGLSNPIVPGNCGTSSLFHQRHNERAIPDRYLLESHQRPSCQA